MVSKLCVNLCDIHRSDFREKKTKYVIWTLCLISLTLLPLWWLEDIHILSCLYLAASYMSHSPKSLSSGDTYVFASSLLPALWLLWCTIHVHASPRFLFSFKRVKGAGIVAVFYWCFEPLWWSFSWGRMKVKRLCWVPAVLLQKEGKIF